MANKRQINFLAIFFVLLFLGCSSNDVNIDDDDKGTLIDNKDIVTEYVESVLIDSEGIYTFNFPDDVIPMVPGKDIFESIDASFEQGKSVDLTLLREFQHMDETITREETYYFKKEVVNANHLKLIQYNSDTDEIKKWISFYKDDKGEITRQFYDNQSINYVQIVEYWPNGLMKETLMDNSNIKRYLHYHENGNIKTSILERFNRDSGSFYLWGLTHFNSKGDGVEKFLYENNPPHSLYCRYIFNRLYNNDGLLLETNEKKYDGGIKVLDYKEREFSYEYNSENEIILKRKTLFNKNGTVFSTNEEIYNYLNSKLVEVLSIFKVDERTETTKWINTYKEGLIIGYEKEFESIDLDPDGYNESSKVTVDFTYQE
ncbi:hypothetical protein [Wenyingzhuangia sp. IMCC45574]